jgi:hypothetical protein
MERKFMKNAILRAPKKFKMRVVRLFQSSMIDSIGGRR